MLPMYASFDIKLARKGSGTVVSSEDIFLRGYICAKDW